MNEQIRSTIESAEVNKMLSATRLLNLYHLLSQVISFGVPGEIVEIGCNTGFSARFIRMVMNCFDCRRNFHVYDSFEGISAPTEGDEGLPDCIKKGDIPSTEAVLIEKFKQFGLQPPVVHKGWVEDILPQQLPKHIAFAHIDVDLYEPIKDSLRAVYPRICHRGIVLVDDYGHPDWPGAKRAADEFAQTITEPLNSLDFHERIAAQYQAFFRKEFMRQTLR